MLMAHKGSVIKTMPEAIFDASGQPPREFPQKSPFAGKTRPERPALAQQKPGTCQSGWKIVQMFQNGNRVNAVVPVTARYLPKIAIEPAYTGAIWAIRPKFLERLDGIAGTGYREIRNVVQITGANLQQGAAAKIFPDMPVHPRFELCHSS